MAVGLVTDVLMVTGGIVCLLASLGTLTMPDVYTRIQAAAKGGTLGLGLLAAATAAHFGDLASWTTAALLIAFVAMTSPVAAHLIARAAHRQGIEPKGRHDEKYDTMTRAGRSNPWTG